ncbi:UPF0561 protein C2orf68 homolog [Aplysia californica]|uniref:UPF0561 protein C2orf68 homolog n=1 Tax=Aplysia californica TaxID=6500 RepID=A0ABM0JUV6_APLCA|nr:UPF0561 protein C2orf68 homolog [Aplysia californica]
MTSHQPKQRINMSHGFMKSVIRNQIDRDNYDKEVKAKQEQVQGKPRGRGSGNRSKKPEIQTYVPPQRSKKDPQENLFTVEYEHKTGEIHKVSMSKVDIPEEVAKKIGAKFELPSVFVDALAQRLHEEMEQRADI